MEYVVPVFKNGDSNYILFKLYNEKVEIEYHSKVNIEIYKDEKLINRIPAYHYNDITGEYYKSDFSKLNVEKGEYELSVVLSYDMFNIEFPRFKMFYF